MSVAARAMVLTKAASGLLLVTVAAGGTCGGVSPAHPEADSLGDGPHVYWQAQGVAKVFYLCDAAVVERRFETRDTLRFNGFCGDSTWEYKIPAGSPEVAPHSYEDVSKIFAVSDIHGEYQPLVNLLRASGVIDTGLHWSWGDGHLVIAGDTFDRGSEVTECLWLFHRLDLEARAEGGRVHFLLGNHETMVMRRDLRYVNEKYTSGIVRRTRVNYTDLFGPDMELGRWLRTKHVAVKLNDVLFVHGGIPPRLAERGVTLAEINQLARETLDSRSYVVAFDEELRDYYGHSDEGPFWYRGYHYAEEGRYPRATPEQVDVILEAYGVSTIVVGHTEVERVMSLYEGRVIGLDIPLGELGAFQGLLWENDQFFRVSGDGSLELPKAGN